MQDIFHWDGEDTAMTVFLTPRAERAIGRSVARYGGDREEAANRLIWRGAQITLPMVNGLQIGLRRPDSDNIEFYKVNDPSRRAVIKGWFYGLLVKVGLRRKPVNTKETFILLERVCSAVDEVAEVFGSTKTDAINQLLLAGDQVEVWLVENSTLLTVSGNRPNWSFQLLNLD